MTYKIDVNIVDDHTMLVQALTESINKSDVAHVSHSYSTLESFRGKMEEWCPDVLLLDISMPDGNGVEFCEELLSVNPNLRVIAITCHDEYSIINRMMDAGVQGYVLKSAPIEELLNAISAVYRGERFLSSEVKGIIERGSAQAVYLTQVEKDVLRYICDGLTNPEIAEQIHISLQTVNWYRKRLLSKFHVKNSVSLATLALREHLI